MKCISNVQRGPSHPYQVVVCFADCRRVKAFRGALKCSRLGGNLFVCNHRKKYYSTQFKFNIISSGIAMTEVVIISVSKEAGNLLTGHIAHRDATEYLPDGMMTTERA